MTMRVRVLGPGCARCQVLFESTKAAIEKLGVDACVEKVNDVGEMAARGILASPALLIDDELVVAGFVPSLSQLEDLLEERV